MPTNRQVISDVVTFLRINNIDERVSYRAILSDLRHASDNFIKQDTDNRRLFKQSKLFKPLQCGIEMVEVPLIECGFDIVDARTMMKSTEKLPTPYYTNYGALIRVSNIDGSKNYTLTNFEDYNDNINRKYVDKTALYFFVVDDYLYIPNAYIETVRVSGFWKTDDYLNAGKCKKSVNCVKPLDQEFNCPDYLIKIVKDTVKQQLLQTLQRPVDEKPNGNANDK